MDLHAMANAIFETIRDDPDAIGAVQAEAKSLAVAMLTDPNASSKITSATVNGQTFTAAGAMSNGQRMRLLNMVLNRVKLGTTISRTAIPIL